MLKISVVLCTFNGEKYIEEQMQSIHRQSKQPDEVLIVDDASTDSTVQIIRNFISEHSLGATWRLSKNPINIGWKRNFMSVLQKASGDLIFLADQDDIWHPRKIELMSNACELNPEIHLLTCDCYPFDEDTLERTPWFLPSLGAKRINHIKIRRSFAECLRPGCTYAIRKCMIDYIDTLWKPEWPHDQFFWCLALAQDRLYHYNKTLVKWRRGKSHCTPRNDKTQNCRLGILERQYQISNAILCDRFSLNIPQNNIAHIKQASCVYEQRGSAIRSRDLIQIFRLLLRLPYYPRKRSWFGDLTVILQTPRHNMDVEVQHE